MLVLAGAGQLKIRENVQRINGAPTTLHVQTVYTRLSCRLQIPDCNHLNTGNELIMVTPDVYLY